ncbi:hypothetical protein AU190_16235 [Mycolicibacterium acapulense]|uniref:Lipoprotein LpqN n=1 Tax=Mycobacterium lehmannii TaxID=2048550 RepID=A0A117JHG0_9MYCO|nr:hypothetical protein [Mycobacterium lehmannii]KUH94811.1 hypothetical protein AU189_18620 [Mycolicibacterium acapulense]KUI06466.1 hypothetical protein AU192_08535 [Mycobacterium lehmannii]KUI09480.1 hypothetical protein AU191_05810 [Mycolicibacterium acapulense]KUI09774.1 hypothetical protein AU190_16235 [Mycolicibacterium acapulense]
MKYAVGQAIALTWLLTACVDNSEGVPIAEEAVVSDTTISATATPPSTAPSDPPVDTAQPGIVPTPQPSAADRACGTPRPDQVSAAVPDPAAPKITVALPAGWFTAAGQGDVALRLTGPDGMWATVTIAETTLPPAEAFERYADDAVAAADISTLSVLPAELCGYSGQKLLGSWAGSPGPAVQFGDRLAHIPTSTGDYLVAVHVEAPAQTAGFDPLGSPLLGEFGIVIP